MISYFFIQIYQKVKESYVTWAKKKEKLLLIYYLFTFL